jgi:hypothetical protein
LIKTSLLNMFVPFSSVYVFCLYNVTKMEQINPVVNLSNCVGITIKKPGKDPARFKIVACRGF